MLDTSKVHTKNGLVQNSCMLSSGFKITVSIATGVCGESTCLTIYDTNCYPDGDSRGERPKEFIIPIDYADDLLDLTKIIQDSILQRNLTLKKKKK